MVAFGLFGLFIGTLVGVCIKQDISLVSKEYYRDELKYQDQMIRISNAQALAYKPVVAKINSNTLELRFNEPVERGSLILFCPSDSNMDRNVDLNLSADHKQLIDISTLKAGMYRAKLSWVENGRQYFMEEVIYI